MPISVIIVICGVFCIIEFSLTVLFYEYKTKKNNSNRVAKVKAVIYAIPLAALISAMLCAVAAYIAFIMMYIVIHLN